MRTQTRDVEAREAKLDALHQKLTDSVSALVTGDDWRRALEFAARFRSRSFQQHSPHLQPAQRGVPRGQSAQPGPDVRRRLQAVAQPQPPCHEGPGRIRDPGASHGSLRFRQPGEPGVVAAARAGREAKVGRIRSISADRAKARARLGPVIPRIDLRWDRYIDHIA